MKEAESPDPFQFLSTFDEPDALDMFGSKSRKPPVEGPARGSSLSFSY